MELDAGVSFSILDDVEIAEQLKILNIKLVPIKPGIYNGMFARGVDENGAICGLIQMHDDLSHELQRETVLQHIAEMHAFEEINSDLIKFLRAMAVEREKALSISVASVVIPEKKGKTGSLIVAHTAMWSAVCRCIGDDWERAFEIPASKWEEIVAGAFDMAGFDEVTLTPRSGDHGRDIIAVRRGVGCVKIIGSVKAYKPGLLVDYDSVRSLIGVMTGERDSSKGIIATTSDFPPKIMQDPFIAPFLPTRLELLNGTALRAWLKDLVSSGRRK